MKDLSDFREDYQKGELNEENLIKNPFELFDCWFDEAIKASIKDPNAFTLATIGLDSLPNARILLLKSLTKQGFTFFTNYQSTKGQELETNAGGCMVFLWKELERQVRVRGIIEKVSKEDSDAYYLRRPAGSRLGAWASPQSQKIPNREFLEQLLQEQKNVHGDEPKERPEFWGGYILKPTQIEFWQGRPSRLHDRIVFEFNKNTNTWDFKRVAP